MADAPAMAAAMTNATTPIVVTVLLGFFTGALPRDGAGQRPVTDRRDVVPDDNARPGVTRPADGEALRPRRGRSSGPCPATRTRSTAAAAANRWRPGGAGPAGCGSPSTARASPRPRPPGSFRGPRTRRARAPHPG